MKKVLLYSSNSNAIYWIWIWMILNIFVKWWRWWQWPWWQKMWWWHLWEKSMIKYDDDHEDTDDKNTWWWYLWEKKQHKVWSNMMMMTMTMMTVIQRRSIQLNIFSTVLAPDICEIGSKNMWWKYLWKSSRSQIWWWLWFKGGVFNWIYFPQFLHLIAHGQQLPTADKNARRRWWCWWWWWWWWW